MIKVLVFGLTSNSGGMESVIMNYYRNIDKSKVHFDFLCKTENPAYKDELLKNGSKIIYTHRLAHGYKKFTKRLNQIFQENQYDVYWHNDCLFPNILYFKLAKKHGIKKIIAHAHNSKNMKTGKMRMPLYIFHKINRLFLHRYVTDFWSCSIEASKFFYTKKIIKSPKHKIILNAIDVESYTFNKNIRKQYRQMMGLSGSLILGSVGRLHFQKNQSFAIELCAAMNKIRKTKLLLVGSGEDRKKLEKQVLSLNLSNDVLFLGNRKDVANLLSAMDVFLMPSLFEGLSVANIEAQTSGLLVCNSTFVNPICKATDKVYFLPLDDLNQWINIIISNVSKNSDRKKYSKIVDNSGFNIKSRAKEVEEYILKKND